MAVTYADMAALRLRLGLAEGDPDPVNGARYLRHATGLVAGATTSAVYTTDAQGLPTSPAVAEAFREAVLDQAEAWVVTGLDPALGRAQIKRTVKQKSLSGGGASVTYDDPDPYLVALAGGRELVSTAYEALWRAGLITTSVNAGPLAHVALGTPYDLTTGRLLP